MARLPALIDALTHADGRPRRAVDHVAREVREAGLIQTTKRGRGAAEMTTLDAAYLILGLYGAANPADAAEAAEELAAYVNVARRKVPAPLRPIKTAPDLVHALAALIELAPLIAPATRDTDAMLEASIYQPADAWPAGYTVHMTFTRPDRGPTMRLVYADAEADGGINETYFIFHGAGLDRPIDTAIKTTVRINGDLFRAVHRALFETQ